MEEASTQPAPPPADPNELLAKLEAIVNKNKAPEGGSKSWVGTVIIIAVVLAGVAVWAWISTKRNRELAKLRHEKNKTKILADKAEFDAQLANRQTQIDDAAKEKAAIDDRLEALDAKIKTEEARYEADRKAIDRIRSWRDVDPSAGG